MITAGRRTNNTESLEEAVPADSTGVKSIESGDFDC